jgi:hypothetical protein
VQLPSFLEKIAARKRTHRWKALQIEGQEISKIQYASPVISLLTL